MQNSDEMPGCPLCGSTTSLWLTVPGDFYRDLRQDYFLCDCGRCRYGFLSPRPTISELHSFYRFSGYYTHQDRQSAGQPPGSFFDRVRIHLAWKADRGEDLADSVLRLLYAQPKAKVLDFGCGNGAIMARLRTEGYDLLGVEIDPDAAAEAQRKGLNVILAGVDEVPAQLEDHYFDICILSHVLEHCIDPLNVLKSLKRVLKSEAVLVCEVPNNSCAGLQQQGACWRWLDVPRHLNFFTPKSLEIILTAAGFSLQGLEYSGYCRMFGNEWLLEQQKIADFQHGIAVRNRIGQMTLLHSWKLLLATMCATSEKKYDSVRVIAQIASADRRHVPGISFSVP